VDKDKFIEWLKQQPDDIQIFMCRENEFNCVDAKIFVKPKDNEFIEWYLEM
jgi:hypothetical protein